MDGILEDIDKIEYSTSVKDTQNMNDLQGAINLQNTCPSMSI